MNSIKTLSLLLICSISFTVHSQQETDNHKIQTLFSNNQKNTYGGFGTPIFGIGQFADQWNAMVGGKGGVIVNRKLAIGLIGMAKVGTSSIDSGTITNDNLNLSYGAGGLFVEYISRLEKPIHLSFPINLMLGGVSIKEDIENGDDSEIESSSVFVLEAGINLEFNMSKYFIPALQVGYRNVFLNETMNLVNENDVSGLYVGLNFKFGKF